jgi:hypothetical protein
MKRTESVLFVRGIYPLGAGIDALAAANFGIIKKGAA